MSRRVSPPDPWMAFSAFVLMLIGALMVASASIGISEVRYGDPLLISRRWLAFIAIALLIFTFVSRLDLNWFRSVALPLVGFSILLLVLVLIPGIGKEINGARRWFSFFGLTVQPVELVKPVLILYMAHYMAAFPQRLQRFSDGLAPMLVISGIVTLLLLLQPDFGSAVLILSVCTIMWFVGGVPVRHLLALAGSALPIVAIVILAEPYRVQRLLGFIDPWSDPYGRGYQLVQSMLAFGSGGIQGVGLGQGVQKLFYLPEPFTDFIFAVLGEELGLWGVLLVIALFAGLLGRAMFIAAVDEDPFNRLLVIGCSAALGLAFFINAGASMGILPTKGMPMPFLSYGGSALIGVSIMLGMIFSVQRRRPVNARKEPS